MCEGSCVPAAVLHARGMLLRCGELARLATAVYAALLMRGEPLQAFPS